MKGVRLRRGAIMAMVLLLVAGVLACQLGRDRPTSEVIVVTPTPELAAPTSPPGEAVQPPSTLGVIVDNADPGFTIEEGDWGACQDGDCQGIPYGTDFRFAERGSTSWKARFDLTVPAGGNYDLYAWWPWGEDRATDTPFTVEYGGGSTTISVDQRNNGDGWYWLDQLSLGAGESVSVLVGGSSTGYANADAIAIVPAGSEPPLGASAAGGPVIQYFYHEEGSSEGCYYLHWDVSDATVVYLDDEEIDNPGSTEVCPEETATYTLWAENEEEGVEQALTVVPGAAALPEASPAPPEQPPATPEGPPPGDGLRSIIFLHHSTGANLIEQGEVRERLTAMGYAFYDHGYNDEGLVLADGTWTGQSFNVPGDNTDPDGFAAIFAQPLHDPPDNTFSHLMQYDVIAFKSCFPVSYIESDAQLSEYKSYYLSIRDRMDQYPDRIFIVVTQPPQVPAETEPSIAERARAWTQWLQSDEYLAGHPNVFAFDFFGLLADGDNVLRAEYRMDEYDSHPNELANRTIGLPFADFIDQAVRSYAGR